MLKLKQEKRKKKKKKKKGMCRQLIGIYLIWLLEESCSINNNARTAGAERVRLFIFLRAEEGGCDPRSGSYHTGSELPFFIIMCERVCFRVWARARPSAKFAKCETRCSLGEDALFFSFVFSKLTKNYCFLSRILI